MNSTLKTTLNILILGSLTLLVVACQDTIPNRETITPDSKFSTTPTCSSTQTLNTVTNVCDENKVVRPTNAISWKADYCVCKDNKSVANGSCSTICASKSTGGIEKLYANFTVGADISLSGLGSVSGWCSTLLANETVNPKCVIEAKDAEGSISIVDVTVPSGTNSLTADLSKLSYDKTYLLTLVEQTSKSKSDSAQIIKYSTDIAISTLGPLKPALISQYTCVVKGLYTETTGTQVDTFSEYAYRLHFYFLPSAPPSPISSGTAGLICYDALNPAYNKFDDSEEYPRLELRPGVFSLWDKNDARFYDNNANTYLDINDVIVQKTKNFGATIPANTNFFAKFSWPGSPTVSTEAGNSTATNQSIGYYMAPWIDTSTFKSYCLGSTHYNSSNALFKAMRDVIGVDTEGLYVGEKAAESLTTTSGTVTIPKDYILIRETDLKQVWFYMKAGVPTAPTDANVADVAVYFYYPLNKDAPYVRSSSQRIYRVKSAVDLSSTATSSAATSTGAATTVPPHDRKIGCIPKVL